MRGAVASEIDVERTRGVTVTIRAERPRRGRRAPRRGALAVVGAIEDAPPGGGDIGWPGLSGRHAVHKVACAEDRLQARSHGPYSLKTQQPLGTEEAGRVQRVGRGAVQVLLARGARATLHEMLTVKSDDPEGRFETYDAIVAGAPAAAPAAPFSARKLEALLGALGFVVDFDEETPSLALATTETIRALAPHAVTEWGASERDELAPRKGGLFCLEIFGPLGSPERRRRFGRVELSEPVLHPGRPRRWRPFSTWTCPRSRPSSTTGACSRSTPSSTSLRPAPRACARRSPCSISRRWPAPAAPPARSRARSSTPAAAPRTSCSTRGP